MIIFKLIKHSSNTPKTNLLQFNQKVNTISKAVHEIFLRNKQCEIRKGQLNTEITTAI